MKTLRLLAALAIAAAPTALLAQQRAIGFEHRYDFRFDQLPSAFQEKVMLETIHGLDPEMRTSVERPESMLRILAYRPLDEQHIVRLAAQHGVALSPAISRTEANPAILTGQ
ncbi:MAG: hypothetical protein ACK4L7_05695 [Flavobacteriales bacterium]